MSAQEDYWAESLSIAAEDCGLSLNNEQLAYMAAAMVGSHECYGMAFYSPPPSDRHHQIERDWKAKYDALQREFDAYRGSAETAVRTALRQYPDASVSIGERGEVFRHGGRTEQIQ